MSAGENGPEPLRGTAAVIGELTHAVCRRQSGVVGQGDNPRVHSGCVFNADAGAPRLGGRPRTHDQRDGAVTSTVTLSEKSVPSFDRGRIACTHKDGDVALLRGTVESVRTSVN